MQGAVGLAIWVPSVANQGKETEASDARTSGRGYSSLRPAEDKGEASWRQRNNGGDRELSVMENTTYPEATDEDTLVEELKVQ